METTVRTKDWEDSVSREDAINKMAGLDHHFTSCAEGGHGVSTKEVMWYRRAAVYAIRTYDNPLTGLRELMNYASSATAKNALRMAIDEVEPGFAKLFAAD